MRVPVACFTPGRRATVEDVTGGYSQQQAVLEQGRHRTQVHAKG